MPRVPYWVIAFLPSVLSQAISLAFCSVSSLDWTFTSNFDSPCQVAADLAAVCAGGEFTLQSLDPGYVYLGPSPLAANSCRCSSVFYSMLSACAACQGNEWLTWNEYDANCTTVYVQQFPQGIPSGTRVPAWAYADVRLTNGFNLSVALSLDSRPESTASSSPTSSFVFPTNTFNTFTNTLGFPTNGPTSFPGSGSGSGGGSGASSHAGAIAGGTIGGVVGLSLIAGLAYFFIRRRNEAGTQPASSAFNTTAYTPAPNNPEPAPDMSYNPNSPFVQAQPQTFQDPADPNVFNNASAPSPYTSTYSSPYSPPPASTTYTSFQSSTPQVTQPYMPTPTPTGHYTGAPEV